MNAQKGQIIDHKDRNGLNCQRYNIRLATYSQNGSNRKLSDNKKYLGVHKINTGLRQKWVVKITHNKKKLHIGTFYSENDAVKAYNEAAIKYHGEFARLNKI